MVRNILFMSLPVTDKPPSNCKNLRSTWSTCIIASDKRLKAKRPSGPRLANKCIEYPKLK